MKKRKNMKKPKNFKEKNSEFKKEKEDYKEENKKINLFIEEKNEQIKKSIPEGMDLNELTQEYEGLKEQNNSTTIENKKLKTHLDNS